MSTPNFGNPAIHIRPGERVTHSCGLDYTNHSNVDTIIHTDICPVCKQVIEGLFMKLKPRQTIRHECGLNYTNNSDQAIDFAGDVCPQCKNPVKFNDITGGQDTTKWTLKPPTGMAFKNELGGDVSLQFEIGREVELFQSLQTQLQAYINAHLKTEEVLNKIKADTAVTLELGVTEEGNITNKHEGR
jgi:hypothetical protein